MKFINKSRNIIIVCIICIIISCLVKFYNSHNISDSMKNNIAAGYWHSLAIRDGEVWSWGANWYGQLGNESTISSSTPSIIKGLKDVVEISAGAAHSVALKKDGSVWTWGANIYGQLGINNDYSIMEISPIKINELSDIIAIACGESHSLALKSDGTVWAWGYNIKGQLGNGDIKRSSTPVKVNNLDNIIAIAAGQAFSVAISRDGSVWTWGQDIRGICEGEQDFYPIPMKVEGITNACYISCGKNHCLTLKNDGTVWGWGKNSNGQIGDGTTVDRKDPTVCINLSDVKSISCGNGCSYAIKKDGTVWAWGGGTFLGDGSTRASIKQVKVKNLDDIVSISSQYKHNIVIKKDMSIWSWGYNWKGQIGNGSIEDCKIPVECLFETPAVSYLLKYKFCKYSNDKSVDEYDVSKNSINKIDPEKEEMFSKQWGLFNSGQKLFDCKFKEGIDINIIPAWKITLGSEKVVVGVLDTGIDINHQDIKDSIYVNKNEVPFNGMDDDNNGYIDDVNGWDFAYCDNNVNINSSNESHGTFAAGIISAKSNGKGIVGVAPNVKILPLKFISGYNGFTSDAIDAIEYAARSGVQIINCSWGWSGIKYNYVLEDLMKNTNILYVCAAGNKKVTDPVKEFYPASFNIPNIISVAAINNEGVIGEESNYGNNVDVAAPGISILCTAPENNYNFFGGTSVAAPYVSGIAALIKSIDDKSTVIEIAKKIKRSARYMKSLDGKVESNGIVDAYEALKYKNN